MVDNIVEAINLIQDVDLVITDLYFHVPPCATHHPSMNVSINEPPAGLVIAIACERAGKPYIVFSQLDHHRYDCWWVYGAMEGYGVGKVDCELFPSVVNGSKCSAEVWANAVYGLTRVAKVEARPTQEQRDHLNELFSEYPRPSREESRKISGVDW